MSLENRRVITREYKDKRIQALELKIERIQEQLNLIQEYRDLVLMPAWINMEKKWEAQRSQIMRSLYEFQDIDDKHIHSLLGDLRNVEKMISVRELVNKESEIQSILVETRIELSKIQDEEKSARVK